ncbi:MAG: class I SAM-dependent methyltransferase [Candidatus Omnitrophica bacterium]|nr:class I SAM-dependent methyltransferase [Candidatus Omnitrophota bacterium]
MSIKTSKTVHEDDWRNIKKDYTFLKKNKDISERMALLINFFKRVKPRKMLDIGCGSGYLGYLIKRMDMDRDLIIKGFDISEYAISQITSYDKTYLLDIDKKDIPEESDYFDMVVCGEVLEHIYDVDHCLDEIKRVLKPGGKAIITTPNFSYWKYRIVCLFGGIPSITKDPRHIRNFNHNFLFSKCSGKDFDVTYSVREKKDPLTKILGIIFSKMVVLTLTKREK